MRGSRGYVQTSFPCPEPGRNGPDYFGPVLNFNIKSLRSFRGNLASRDPKWRNTFPPISVILAVLPGWSHCSQCEFVRFSGFREVSDEGFGNLGIFFNFFKNLCFNSRIWWWIDDYCHDYVEFKLIWGWFDDCDCDYVELNLIWWWIDDCDHGNVELNLIWWWIDDCDHGYFELKLIWWLLSYDYNKINSWLKLI